MSADPVFRRAFDHWTRHIRGTLGQQGFPVLLRQDHDVHWYNGGRHEQHTITGEAYNQAKRLAHAPVELIMQTLAPGATAPDRLPAVLRDPVAELVMGSQRVSTDTLDALIRACSDYLDHVHNGHLSPAYNAVLELARRTYAPIQTLINAVSLHEAQALHACVTSLRRQTDEVSWSATYFGVITGIQPRYKEVSLSYFREYLARTSHMREGGEHRVVACVGCDTRDDALDLIAKRIVNRELSQVFTGSPSGLDQDVLGESAQRAVDLVLRDVHS